MTPDDIKIDITPMPSEDSPFSNPVMRTLPILCMAIGWVMITGDLPVWKGIVSFGLFGAGLEAYFVRRLP